MVMILDRFGNNITAKATATKKGKVNPSAIIAKIAETFKDRSRKDIDKWRSAIKMAELPDNPRRDMLYSLIDDLKTDGHLQNQKRLLKSVVLNTEFQIIDKQTGDIDVDKTDFFRSKWFYSVLDIL
jgi:isocitrate dehydrogenase kinase/phosphatase